MTKFYYGRVRGGIETYLPKPGGMVYTILKILVLKGLCSKKELYESLYNKMPKDCSAEFLGMGRGANLKDAGYIVRTRKGREAFFDVTEKGKDYIKLTKDSLSGLRKVLNKKNKIDKFMGLSKMSPEGRNFIEKYVYSVGLQNKKGSV